MTCVYRAKPIDLANAVEEHDLMTAFYLERMQALDQTLEQLNVFTYYPERAWQVANYTDEVTSQILAVNMQAVNVADLLVVYSPGLPTIGVGREIQQAVHNRTPVLLFRAPAPAPMWSSADLDTYDLSDETESLQGRLIEWVHRHRKEPS